LSALGRFAPIDALPLLTTLHGRPEEITHGSYVRVLNKYYTPVKFDYPAPGMSVCDFLDDAGEIRRFVAGVKADERRQDIPEDLAGGLKQVLELSWRPHSRKAVFVFSDAVCHGLQVSQRVMFVCVRVAGIYPLACLNRSLSLAVPARQYHDLDPSKDYFPDGDPKGLVPEELLMELMQEQDMNITFVRITDRGDKMIQVFNRHLRGGVDGGQHLHGCDAGVATIDFIASGLKWIQIGSAKPTNGRELSNAALADALASKTEFTQPQWDTFGIKDLHFADFVRVGNVYYRPGGNVEPDILGKLKSVIIDAVCQQNAQSLMNKTQMLARTHLMGRKWSHRARESIAQRDTLRNDHVVRLLLSCIQLVLTRLSDPMLAHQVSSRLHELGSLFLCKVARSDKFRDSVGGGIMAATGEHVGATELILGMWRKYRERLSDVCSECLSLLARSSTIAEHLSKHDLEFILHELRDSTRPATAASSVLILTLLCIEGGLREQMQHLPVVETIVEVMRHFECDARVQWTSCQALHKLALPELPSSSSLRSKLRLPDSPSFASSRKFREIMATQGCASLIARAMRHHMGNGQVQEHGRAALEALPDTQGLRAVLIVEAQKHLSGSDGAAGLQPAIPPKSPHVSEVEAALRKAREDAFHEANSLSPISPLAQTLHHHHLSTTLSREGHVVEVLDNSGSPVAKRLFDEGGTPGHLILARAPENANSPGP